MNAGDTNPIDRSWSSHRIFLLTLATFTAFWVTIPYAVASSGAICKLTRNPWVVIVCAKAVPSASRALPQADLLLIGDSALAVGIKANRIARETGLSTVNLGLSAPVFRDDGTNILRTYLASHTPPKLIVFYVGPIDLSDGFDAGGGVWGETVTYDILASHWRDMASQYDRHWERVFEYSAAFYSTASWTLDPTTRFSRQALSLMKDENGWLDFSYGHHNGLRPLGGCPTEQASKVAPSETLVKQMRSFETPKTKVLIYLAPLPMCESALTAYHEAFAGVADNTEQTLPTDLFYEDNARLHLNSVGADMATDLLADFVKHAVPAARSGT